MAGAPARTLCPGWLLSIESERPAPPVPPRTSQEAGALGVMTLAWDHNIWTGNSFLLVSDSTRIVRMGEIAPYVYYAEDWTAVSPGNPPHRSPCGSMASARKWLRLRARIT